MSEWVLGRHRLALGIEPIDAVRQAGLLRSVVVEIEGPHGRETMARNAYGRHVLIGPKSAGAAVDVVIYDRRRGYVPRRLRVPMPEPDERGVALRTRRPTLFPGVAWDLGGGATVLRGRVRRDEEPVRWAWIEGRRPGEAEVVVRTRTDDRGEFLLVIDVYTLPVAELSATLDIELRVFGPSSAPVLPPNTEDPLWDLPLETLASPGDPDPTAAGAPPTLPSGWTTFGDRPVTLTVGRTTAGTAGELDF